MAKSSFLTIALYCPGFYFYVSVYSFFNEVEIQHNNKMMLHSNNSFKAKKMNLFISKTWQGLSTAFFAILLCTTSSCKKDSGGTGNPPGADGPPTIISLSSATLHYGDTLTISGSNFSATAANNTVYINGVAAKVITASNAQLKVVTPAVGNNSGEVKVTVNGQSISGGNIQYIPDIFFTGTETDYNYSFAKAMYWKNGTATTLSTATYAEANAIFVNGSDVYIAGAESSKAVYWKNNVKTTLGSNLSTATSVVVSGGDVYVAGYEQNASGVYIAKYWKNGTAVTLGSNRSYAYAITIVGSDVYVAGAEMNNSGTYTARYWKNGTAVTLAANYSYAYAICANRNDVYLAGFEVDATKAEAKYWKNGVAQSLTPNDEALCIAMKDNDVYLAGNGKYWKNNVVYSLPGYYSEGNAIAIFGDNVYISGSYYPGAVNWQGRYWINGVAAAATFPDFTKLVGIFVR